MKYATLWLVGWLMLASVSMVKAQEQPLVEQADPARKLSLDVHGPWMLQLWEGSHTRMGGERLLENGQPLMRWTANVPQQRYIWTYDLPTPIDWAKYPILVIRYRSKNHVKEYPFYTVWLDDGRGPSGGGICPFLPTDIISDGQIHEFRKDLRELKPGGPTLFTMRWCLVPDAAADLTFDLFEMSFHTVDGLPAPAAAPPVTVKVVDEQGQPLRDAKVTIDAIWKELAISKATDAQGQVVLTPRQASMSSHSVNVEMPGYATLPDQKVGVGEAATVMMHQAMVARGKVSDAQGQAIAGAAVCMRMQGQSGWTLMRTDEQGQWQSPAIFKQSEQCSMEILHPNYVGFRASFEPSQAIAISQLLDGEFTTVLQSGAIVQGVVTNSSGEPVKNTSIMIGEDRVTRLEIRTDDQGRYRSPLLPAIRTRITVESLDYAPQMQFVDLKAEPMELNWTLEKGRRIEGVVKTADGQPVVGVSVNVNSWGGAHLLQWRVETDAQGRFVYPNAPLDRVELLTWRMGEFVLWQPVQPGQTTEVQFVVGTPKSKLRGLVVDARDGQPITRASIILRKPRKTPEGYDIPGWLSGAHTHNQGQFEIEHAESTEGVFMDVYCHGYEKITLTDWSAAQTEEGLRVELQPTQTMQGKVVDAAGNPLKGAEVSVLRARNRIFISRGNNIAWPMVLPALTNVQGEFAVTTEQEQGILIATHPTKGYATHFYTSKLVSPTLTLRPWARLEGQVLSGGKPRGNVKIQAMHWRYDHEPPADGEIQLIQKEDTYTDAQGRFILSQLIEAEMMVSQFNVPDPVFVPTAEQDFRIENRALRVQLKSGEVTRWTMPGNGRPVIGTVTPVPGVRGKEWDAASVTLTPAIPHQPAPLHRHPEADDDSPSEAYRALIRPDGSFTLEDIPPGVYELNAGMRLLPIDPVTKQHTHINANERVLIPRSQHADSSEPFDLGEIQLQEQVINNE